MNKFTDALVSPGKNPLIPLGEVLYGRWRTLGETWRSPGNETHPTLMPGQHKPAQRKQISTRP